MIINFSVENFRSIKNKVTLSFEASKSNELEDYYIRQPKNDLRLLKVGIIYGANASGKTNLLEAIDFLRNIVIKPFEKKTKSFEFEPYLFDPLYVKKNTFISIEFIQEKIKYLYEIELNTSAIVQENLYFYNPNKANIYKRKTNIEKQLTEVVFGSKIRINKESKSALLGNTLWNNTVLGGFLKTNFDSPELQNVLNWFKQKLKPIIKPRTELIPFVSNYIEKNKDRKNIIIEILKKADFGISDIILKKEDIEIDKDIIALLKRRSIISDEDIDKMKKTGRAETTNILLQHTVANDSYYLSLDKESAGTQRYYEFSGILSLLINDRSILLIDELESSLHPDLVKHFLLTFLVNSGESQLISTTHHRELLMEKDILRNDAVWFTEKSEDCCTDLFSLNDFNSSIIRNTSSIYNAYKIGKLGAVPKLNDYYIEIDDEKK